LGIMAGICDDIDPVEQIDRLIPAPTTASQYWASGESCGHQRLGFVNRPLYLPPEFFTDKVVDLDLPIGPGITAEVLNEDNLRHALDALYEAGLRRYSRRWPRPYSSMALGIASSLFHSQVCLPHTVVLGQFLSSTLQDDPTGFQDISVVCDMEGGASILLD